MLIIPTVNTYKAGSGACVHPTVEGFVTVVNFVPFPDGVALDYLFLQAFGCQALKIVCAVFGEVTEARRRGRAFALVEF